MKFSKEDRNKYRAWDEGVSQMFYGNGVTLDELSGLAKEIALGGEPGDRDQWFVDNSKCKWMESTGASTVDDVLIFESDIIENKNGTRFVIQWDPWKCGFLAYKDGTYVEIFGLEKKSGPIRVVGNAYENPELLK